MYSGSEDGTIKIWDLRAPGCQREYESGSSINTVGLHPNQCAGLPNQRASLGRTSSLPSRRAELISGDRDGNIRVWDLGENACSAELVPDGSKARTRPPAHWLDVHSRLTPPGGGGRRSGACRSRATPPCSRRRTCRARSSCGG